MARLTEVEQDCPLNAGEAETKCDYYKRYWKGYATKNAHLLQEAAVKQQDDERKTKGGNSNSETARHV